MRGDDHIFTKNGRRIFLREGLDKASGFLPIKRSDLPDGSLPRVSTRVPWSARPTLAQQLHDERRSKHADDLQQALRREYPLECRHPLPSLSGQER